MDSSVVSANVVHISESLNDLTSFSYLTESTMECMARMMTVLVPRSTKQSMRAQWMLEPSAFAEIPQSTPIRFLLLKHERVIGS